MSNIDINIKWIEEIVKKFGTSSFKNHLNDTIQKITIFLQWESIKEAPVWVWWQLRSWIQTEFSDLQGRVYNAMKYWDYVHQWTKPHFPPIKAIEQWARIKWLSPYAVAWSIFRKWTKANPYFDRALQKNESKINQITNQEMQKFINQLN